MSGRNDKWSMFTNYMHNELGITKEDIRTWIQEAVSVEAKKIIYGTYGHEPDVRKIVQDHLKTLVFDRSWGTDKVKEEIAKQIGKEVVDRMAEGKYKL